MRGSRLSKCPRSTCFCRTPQPTLARFDPLRKYFGVVQPNLLHWMSLDNIFQGVILETLYLNCNSDSTKREDSQSWHLEGSLCTTPSIPLHEAR